MTTTKAQSEFTPARIAWLLVLTLGVGIAVASYVNQPVKPSASEVRRAEVARASAEAIKSAIQSRRLIAGMSSADVLKVWGEPQKIDRTTVPNHVEEFWIYSGDRMAHLDNGVLLSFNETLAR